MAVMVRPPSYAYLVALLDECSNDLGAEINLRYVGLLEYPDNRKKYEQDMKIVWAARRAVNGAENAQ